jgi:cysteine desulfurase
MKPNSAIYLDYNATTPIAPEVMNEMLPYYLTAYGNASSADHIYGWQAKEAVEEARTQLASNLGAHAKEMLFTAGATESINMALRGIVANKVGKKHIITVSTEHSAVIDTCKALEEDGDVSVTYLSVDRNGLIDLTELEEAIIPSTVLVSIMWVNNETGVIQPIPEIASICAARGILFMSDATQAIGKTKINLAEIKIDIIVGSAHKIYGPKGVGFIYLRKPLIDSLMPIITGGGQEMRKRAGTTNVPSIIGLASSVRLAMDNFDLDRKHIAECRDRFEHELTRIDSIHVNGSVEDRLYNTSNLMFKGKDSELLMQQLGSKLAASRGSACSSGGVKASHVLSAMGLTTEEANASIRFSFGRYTTQEEVSFAVAQIMEIL